MTTRLQEVGFSGRIESTLTQRLGRPLNQTLANIGRLLWFDTVTGLNGDNTCAGCHSPTNGFGDSQPIAIGIDNNGIVGPDRSGPRNMRRAPMVLDTAFFPSLMWNSRVAADYMHDGAFTQALPTRSATTSTRAHPCSITTPRLNTFRPTSPAPSVRGRSCSQHSTRSSTSRSR